MAIEPKLQRFVEARLRAGLSKRDAAEIFARIAADTKGSKARRARALKAVEKEFGKRFTAAGRDTWAELKGERAPQPKSAPQLNLRLDGEHQRLRDLRLPPVLLEAALTDPASRVGKKLMAEVTQLEATAGDGDGVLAPRDLARASPLLKRLVGEVFARRGAKTTPLADVRAELGPAWARLYHSRDHLAVLEPDELRLYLDLAGEAFDTLARDYKREVISKGQPSAQFFAARGLRDNSQSWSVRKALRERLPPPRKKEISALYRRVLSGTLSHYDFYATSRLDADGLRKLQRDDPKLFPLPHVSDPRHPLPTGARGHPTGVRRPSGPKLTYDRKGAEAVAAAAWERVNEDPLIDVAELVDALNANAAFTARFGSITRNQYEKLRAAHRDLLPNFADSELWQGPIAKELEAWVKAHPGGTRTELVAALHERHPNFDLNALYRLQKAKPGLPVPNSHAGQRTESDLKAVAVRIFELLDADPTLTRDAVAEALGREGTSVDGSAVTRLIHRFARELGHAERVEGTTKIWDELRSSRPVRQTLQLLIAVSPPGTTNRQVVAALNDYLVRRGLPPYKESALDNLDKVIAPGDLTPREHGARVAAELIAEYARAAPAGSSEAEILARVRADYPSLDNRVLGTYEPLWRASPHDYPSLEPFSKGAQVSWKGLGEKVQKPRYLGGWQVDRALLGASKKEREALARLTQSARIPLRLPMIDAVVDRLHGAQPLQQKNLLWVSHLLADAVATTHAMRRAGLARNHAVVVGTPYGANGEVVEALREQGLDVRVPPLSEAAYRDEVKKALDRVIALSEQNGQPIVVMDDGGLVTQLLHSDDRYATVRGRIKVVEQTTGGILLAEKSKLDTRVVAVARARSKAKEGEYIGAAVARAVSEAVERHGGLKPHAKVAVVGYGVIGRAIARALADAGYSVSVAETSKERAAEAAKDGLTVRPQREALDSAKLVIGATGKQTLKLDDLERLAPEAMVASASSKRVEIDMAAVEAAATSREELDPLVPLATLPTAKYRLGKHTLTVLGDGWPVNFDGDVVSVPSEQIQLTWAAMLAGLFQASSDRGSGGGLVALDAETDDWLLRTYAALGPPKDQQRLGLSSWADVVRDASSWLESAEDGDTQRWS